MTSLPHRNDLMAPIVDVIRSLGGSASNEEIAVKVISSLDLPESFTTLAYITKRGTEDGRTLLEYDLAWAGTYLKQQGLLTNSAREVWSLTGKEYVANSVRELELGLTIERTETVTINAEWFQNL